MVFCLFVFVVWLWFFLFEGVVGVFGFVLCCWVVVWGFFLGGGGLG